jgi:formate hydrogenlyase subunit 3/multisubunit Na+/H+ antiporter MnhD subunit
MSISRPDSAWLGNLAYMLMVIEAGCFLLVFLHVGNILVKYKKSGDYTDIVKLSDGRRSGKAFKIFTRFTVCAVVVASVAAGNGFLPFFMMLIAVFFWPMADEIDKIANHCRESKL